LHKLGIMTGPRILLVIGGGIAAYKSCELVRLIRKQGGAVTCVLTKGGAQFVTPMTLAALSENPVHSNLWDLKNEVEMGHIQLSRQADLIVVCPATADLMAKMAHGIADDLATTLLLATDKQVLAVPAMNVRMWDHAATQANVATLRARGVTVLEPDEGPMACGEFGPGRLPEPAAVMEAIDKMLASGPLAGQPDFEADPAHRSLFGKHVLVTAGPTHEPIDPVRYIANRSSGKQGFAIAAAAARAGARVTLVSGPVALPTPPGVDRVDVETAREMAEAVCRALPADCAVMVAAVADWRTEDCAPEKMKKRGSAPPALRLTENPDILATVAASDKRPRLVVGFAAETEKVLEHATEKRKRKGADWIVANDVSGGVMGGDVNLVHIVSSKGVDHLPELPKDQVADALVERIADALNV
jgi:phosphopantothenoylcysteine decarboxylase/phosphopantothenate--cysteine ligase